MADLYARIVDGAIAEERRFDAAPDPNPAKGLDWRLYIKPEMPDFNSATHHAPAPFDDIQDERVVRTWAAAIAKTAQELDADKTTRATTLASERALRVMKLAYGAIYDLKKSAAGGALSIAEFEAWLDGLPDVPDKKFVDIIKPLID